VVVLVVLMEVDTSNRCPPMEINGGDRIGGERSRRAFATSKAAKNKTIRENLSSRGRIKLKKTERLLILKQICAKYVLRDDRDLSLPMKPKELEGEQVAAVASAATGKVSLSSRSYRGKGPVLVGDRKQSVSRSKS